MATKPTNSAFSTGYQQVQTFLENLEHPFKQEIEEVRRIVLRANPQLTELIKWNAPSFCYQGQDRITFNLQGKGFFRLIFHCGAKAIARETKEPLFHDTTGLLDWQTSDRAIARFSGMADVKAKEAALTAVVTKWLEVAC